MTVRYPYPAHRKQVAKRRDAELAQVVREAQQPAQTGPVEYSYAENLSPTLPGMVHGIIGHAPWRVQCDGCGSVETLELLVLIRTRFNPVTRFNSVTADPRRLCGDCQKGAGW